MKQRIAHIALVVDDYDKAIDYYTNTLDFTLIEDTPLDASKRWVIVAPNGAKECSLLLAKAATDQQANFIGNQTGGRVFLFLFTDDFSRDYQKYQSRAVNFIRPLQEFPYGRVAVFEDIYGNRWDLIEPNDQNKGLLS